MVGLRFAQSHRREGTTMKRFDIRFTFEASDSFFDIDANNEDEALDLAYEQLLNKYPDLIEVSLVAEKIEEVDPND